MKRLQLWKQIVIASILGLILGLVSKTLGVDAKFLGDIFIRMIQMTIVPLIFPLIVLGVAKMKTGKAVGRLAIKAIVYFEVVTTALMIIAVCLVNLFGTGVGANLAGGDAATIARFAEKSISFTQFILNIVPKNLFVAFTEGNILAILFFGILFGLGLGALGERGKPLVSMLDSLCQTMFNLLRYVLAVSPIGVFGFVAYSVAAYGWGKVATLWELIFVVYVGLAFTVFVIFPIIARIFHVRYFALLGEIKDLLIIAASTRSSESVLAPAMERLEGYGVKNSAVSFVLPLGYSFNLDGGSVYWAPAILYIANAYGANFTWLQQAQVVLVLMLLSKGVAGVVGGNFVVLTTVATAFGLPLEGIALIFAVDFITDIARTVTNVIGNALATVCLAKSEGMFDPSKKGAAEAALE